MNILGSLSLPRPAYPLSAWRVETWEVFSSAFPCAFRQTQRECEARVQNDSFPLFYGQLRGQEAPNTRLIQSMNAFSFWRRDLAKLSILASKSVILLSWPSNYQG